MNNFDKSTSLFFVKIKVGGISFYIPLDGPDIIILVIKNVNFNSS